MFYVDEYERIRQLEFYATRIAKLGFTTKEWEGFSYKSYDPLTIEIVISHYDSTEYYEAHSYVFDFENGSRHHSFKSLDEIEEALDKELYKLVEDYKHDR